MKLIPFTSIFVEKAIAHGMNQSLSNPWLLKYFNRYAPFSQTLLLAVFVV
jgi:hypothetical protein